MRCKVAVLLSIQYTSQNTALSRSSECLWCSTLSSWAGTLLLLQKHCLSEVMIIVLWSWTWTFFGVVVLWLVVVLSEHQSTKVLCWAAPQRAGGGWMGGWTDGCVIYREKLLAASGGSRSLTCCSALRVCWEILCNDAAVSPRSLPFNIEICWVEGIQSNMTEWEGGLPQHRPPHCSGKDHVENISEVIYGIKY